MRGVQYLVDDRGERRAVVIDLKKQGELWEDFYDRALAESRRDEPRESLESVKARLRKARGRLTVADYRLIFTRSARKELENLPRATAKSRAHRSG